MSEIGNLADSVLSLAVCFDEGKNSLQKAVERIEREQKLLLEAAISAEFERIESIRLELAKGLDTMLSSGSLDSFSTRSFNDSLCKIASMDRFSETVWYTKLTEMCTRSNSYVVACDRWRLDQRTGHANPVWTIKVPAERNVDDEKMRETVRLMETLWSASQAHGEQSNFNGVFIMNARIEESVRQILVQEKPTGEWILELYKKDDSVFRYVTAREVSGGASPSSPLALLEWVSEQLI